MGDMSQCVTCHMSPVYDVTMNMAFVEYYLNALTLISELLITCACICICVYVCVYASVCVLVYMSMCVCMRLCVCVLVYV